VVSETISNFGDWFYLAAILGLIYDRGGITTLTVYNTFKFAPLMVMTAAAGFLIDRLSAKRVLVTSALMSAVILGGLSVALAVTSVPIALLVALALVNAIVTAVTDPARQALVVESVPEDNYMPLNASLGVVGTSAMMFAPVLGGLVLSISNSSYLFGANALTFVAAAAIISGVRSSRHRASVVVNDDAQDTSHAPEQTESITEQTPSRGRRALAFMGGPRAMTVAILILVSHFIVAATWVVLPVLSKDILGSGDIGIGILATVLGTGSVLGMIIGGGLEDRLQERQIGLLSVVFALCVCAAAMATLHPVVGYASIGLMGFFACVIEPSMWATLQSSVAPDRAGKVFGFLETATIGVSMIGSAVAGGAIIAFGYSVGVAITGLVPMLCVIVLLVVRPRQAGSNEPASSGANSTNGIGAGD